MTLSRAEYLTKIRAREFGGDRRKVQIQSVHVQGDLARVVAKSRGKAASFESAFHLVRTDAGWQLTNDMATVVFLK